jgi:signal transduction histidine kinase
VSRLVYGARSNPYEALTRLGHRLQDAPDPDDVLSTIVDDVAAALRLAYCAVELRYDDELELAAERGRSGPEQRLVLPLAYQGEEIGTLIAEPGPKRQLSAEDKALLGDLARQAGVAIHGVRVMADLKRSRERLVVAREEERLRLRRDLHDGLGPTLAALVLKSGLARESIARDPERTEVLLRELSADARNAIADIRQVVYELRPPALDELGLTGALRERAALLSDSSGITISFDSKLPASLPPAVEVAAYRIVAEALTNVARHSQAQTARVTMCLADGVEITVADDGIGIDPGSRAGVGLRSMRDRATELGGSFGTTSGSTGGLAVHVVLPLDP